MSEMRNAKCASPGTAASPGPFFGTTNACIGSEVPFEKALAATFLEGLVFLLICVTGLRSKILKIFPRTVRPQWLQAL